MIGKVLILVLVSTALLYTYHNKRLSAEEFLLSAPIGTKVTMTTGTSNLEVCH